MSKISRFVFVARPTLIGKQGDFLAIIPPGIEDKKVLLETFSRNLKLPDYFGHNWDALDECIRDLSWIDERLIVLAHSDVPNLPGDEAGVYLEIIANAVGQWAASGQAPTSSRISVVDAGKSCFVVE